MEGIKLGREPGNRHMNHSETNSDTHRDIKLMLEDLKKVRSDDMEAGLERGKSLDIKDVVITALGG